jgi:DDE family transposase
MQKSKPQEVFATVPPHSAPGFAQEHFGTADLKHKKRNAALLRTAERVFRHPGGTLPNKMGHPNDYKAMDVLMNRPETTHASVLAAHLTRTRAKIAAQDEPVLVLHDTTTLDYSGLKTIDLGPVGDGHGRGYLCHNSLAIDPRTREVVGLAHQILHRREAVGKNESVKAKRERESRESRLWTTAIDALGTPTSDGPHVIDVADRGADIFEFLAAIKRLGRSCLVRAQHNRNIWIGHGSDNKPAKLFDHMRSLPTVDQKTKKIYESSKEKERTVELSFAHAAVRLLPPHVRKGEYPKEALALWCVRVWETKPPKGKEPLEWFLLTFEPIDSAATARTMSSYYECRYVIEEYHKGQKTGCQIEDLQFETEQALQPMIALLSVVATVLVNLRQACRRPDADTCPATAVVHPIYEEIMRAHRYKQPHEPLTIKEFYMAVARLGGHMNRRSDGLPGWLTLWRGWTKLQLLVAGAEADRRHRKNAG